MDAPGLPGCFPRFFFSARSAARRCLRGGFRPGRSSELGGIEEFPLFRDPARSAVSNCARRPATTASSAVICSACTAIRCACSRISASRGSADGSPGGASVTARNHPGNHAHPPRQHHARRWNVTHDYSPQHQAQGPECLLPQGGTVSPILSNIYLHKLDEFVERELIPQYTRGAFRKGNTEYWRIRARQKRARKRGDRAAARDLEKQLRTLPSADPMDPGYRRLQYTRYADDHILGFTGPKAEAGEIKARLARFLRETLGLELNQQKTLITHARSQSARFLGYHVRIQHCDTKLTNGRRSVNGKIALRVPPDVIKAQCARYREHGKPWHRSRLQNLDDYDIVRTYGAEYRGVVGYYLLAQDVWRLGTLHWHAVTSMLKTLGAKHRSSVTKMAARHKAKIETRDGPRTCFEARKHREGKKDLVARFGGIILRQDRRAVIRDPAPAPVPYPRKELITRLRRRECELCETGTTVAVHQVTSLKALGKPGPASPRGPPSWRECGARRSSSAPPATSTSTRAPSRTRHKSRESPVR